MADLVVDVGVFARAWAVHTRQLAWFLGAGASAAANVPTASAVVDDLLLRLYADAHDLVRQSLDISDPLVLARVHNYYDNANGMPPRRSAGDYSAALELALPDGEARRAYLRELVAGCSPGYGQRVLGALVAGAAADFLITTNFDDLVERAAVSAEAVTSRADRPLLAVAALQSNRRAARSMADDRWPLLVKLHGDVREDHLKNVEPELRAQDDTLRRGVIDASRRFGLVVAGYSGRDASVMDMLAEAVRRPDAFPAGLWWVARDPISLLPGVRDLLAEAAANGVSTHVVECANFDELMGAVGRQADLSAALRSYVDGLRPRARATDAALPVTEAAPFPILRMNALPVLSAPSHVLQADLGASDDGATIRSRLREVGWHGCAAPGGGQLLAFGDPAVLRSALELTHAPRKVNVNLLGPNATSTERALVGEALSRGLGRRLPVRVHVRDTGNRLVLRPARNLPDGRVDHSEAREALATAYHSPTHGTLPADCGLNRNGESRAFAEAVRLLLDVRLGHMWLLVQPFTWTEPSAEAQAWGALPVATRGALPPDPAAAWKRERWVTRRNEYLTGLVDTWARLLAPQKVTSVHALSRADAQVVGAVGGSFTVGGVTAYSREAG